jgi:GT2 family glycosyltransferase
MQIEKIEGDFRCSIIIPVFNTLELVRKNLPNVLDAYKNKKNKIIEIVVVDDASPDKTGEFIKKEFPVIRLIKHTINRGFSSAVNTGVRAARGNIIVLLNSDVVPSVNFLENALINFNDKTVFAVSLHERGESWANARFTNGYISQSRGDVTDKVHESFWVSGGSGVFRRDYWISLGGFDEKLLSPFYKEDLDLGYRAAKRGLINLWDPNALVEHKHETTMRQLNQKFVMRIRERNELLVHWKNIISRNLFRKHMIGMFKRLIVHPGYIRIILMALSKLPLVIKERKKELLASKVSDESVFARFKKF